jgi:hypothetical protein
MGLESKLNMVQRNVSNPDEQGPKANNNIQTLDMERASVEKRRVCVSKPNHQTIKLSIDGVLLYQYVNDETLIKRF